MQSRSHGLNANVLSEFIDRRIADKAGGVTIAGDLSTFQAVIDWAIHARQLDLPARLGTDARRSLKHRQLDTRGKERSREPTERELARLYAYWNGNERQLIEMPTLVRFALASGMRLGEICGIRIEDIDRRERTVVIRDRKDPRRKQGNDQIVPLLDDAWSIVAPLIKRRTDGRVFEVNAKSASTAFTRACQALGIVDLHFHDLRHAATAAFFRMGLDIPRVALLTGHKTWAMLRRYTDIRPSDVRDAVKPRPARRAAIAGGEVTARRDRHGRIIAGTETTTAETFERLATNVELDEIDPYSRATYAASDMSTGASQARATASGSTYANRYARLCASSP